MWRYDFRFIWGLNFHIFLLLKDGIIWSLKVHTFLVRSLSLIRMLRLVKLLILIEGAILEWVIFLENNIGRTELGVNFILFEGMLGEGFQKLLLFRTYGIWWHLTYIELLGIFILVMINGILSWNWTL